MSETPAAAIHHSLPDETAEDLRDEIRDRLPDVAVHVAGDESETERLLVEEGVPILLTYSLDADLAARADGLRWVQALSSGVDDYDLERLRARGVTLTNAAGVHAHPIAQHVFGFLLAVERNFTTAFRQQREREWDGYEVGELTGETLGVLGVGAVGTRVAELGRAFGMDVIGTKRDPTDAPDAVDELLGPDGTDAVCAAADYLVVCCPLTGETRGLVGAEQLALLGGEGVLVNVGRGAVVDEDALVDALRDGTVRAAGLDVFEEEPLPAESPLWEMENVVVTPHLAGRSPRLEPRKANLFAENYRRFVAGEVLRNRVV
ncbi:MAG: D-2-hydroxyacid dehydrogenase [Halobacteriaceae archaeon]